MSRLSETGHISQKEAATICGITVRAFQNWNLPQDGADGAERLYLVSDVVGEIVRRRVEKEKERWVASEPAYADDGTEINENLERKKKLKAERIGQEIKNAVAIGQLAEIGLLVSVHGDIAGMVNTHLESLPAVIKRAWPEIDGSVLDKIERECVALRNNIADSRIEFTDARMDGFE